METLEFVPVETDEQIETVCILARQTWNDRFLPAYGSVKVEYMLRTYQSAPEIRRQIDECGLEYRLIRFMGANIGYLIMRAEADLLWVCQVYIVDDYQGNRTVSGVLLYLEGVCFERGLSRIEATIDSHNTSFFSYLERMGFYPMARQRWEVGNGWTMERRIFEKKLKK